MTRVLSELLGATEPLFRQHVSRLEAASGHESTDIRLSTEVVRATKLKLRELGLDPQDTTGSELYGALQQRVKADDERLTTRLREQYGHDKPVAEHVNQALLSLPVPKDCFALKSTVAKALLKKLVPKQTMKALGYRSFDSMMRREQVFAVYAAARLLESVSWRKSLMDQYKKLHASDFELRQMSFVAPNSNRWQALAEVVVAQKKHNTVGLKELGSIVLLPMPVSMQPPGAMLATLLLALHEMNEVRASSTFLKLCQVKPHFGTFLQMAVTDEPMLGAQLLNGPVPWQVVQRYYARFRSRFRTDLFEPHIQQGDLSWHSIEKALSFIEPSLAFWHHTTSLALLHERQPVSLNIIDAALNYCNQLPYENRIVQYFRHSLWHELAIRYLKHDNVEQLVLGSLQMQLAEEPVVV